MYVMVTGMSKACRSPGHSCYAPITIEAQTSVYTQVLTQHKQYAGTRPSFPVWTRRYEVSPHCHTMAPLGVLAREIPLCNERESLLQCSSCSQDLTVTHLYQKTTSHLSDTTWDMRHTKCVPVACNAMWCHVMVCDTDSLPATQPVAVLGWLSHIINHGPLQVRSCHQSWSSSLACSFWLLPLLPSVHQGLSHSLPTPQSCCVTANTSDMHEMELWRAWGIVEVYRYGQQIHIDMSKWLLRIIIIQLKCHLWTSN